MSGSFTIGSDPVVRVTAGDGSQQQGREYLERVREAATSLEAVEVGSTGHPGLEPLVMATLDGETAFFSSCPVERVPTVVEALEDGDLPTENATAVVDHGPETATLPVPEEGPLAVGSRQTLGQCGWVAPASLEDYQATETALEPGGGPDDARERIAASDLRGRGRGDASADESIAAAWETTAEAAGDPVVVVNANEADDTARGDRLLVESAPLSVLVPAVAVADAIDATDVVVYLGESQELAAARAEAAADVLAEESDLPVPVRLVVGPDEYKSGEPTMALEAIEGNHRIEARRQPPGPSEWGLDGRPTLVHTPRTLAQVGRVLAGEDPGGAEADPGTRLVTVAGDVSDPATVELSTGTTLETATSAVESEGDYKAACVGGVFGGLTRSLDVPASAQGMTSARLGTNGVVELVGESTCVVALAGERAKFARDENCGRCAPCREGSKQLVNLLRDVYDGEFEAGLLRELSRTMRETSLCDFGSDAARPVATAVDTFETEFAAHANGNCPAGSCTNI